MAPEPPSPSPWIAELMGAVGEEAVLLGADAEPFSVPWRGRPGIAAAAIKPGTAQAVLAAVRVAERYRLRLLPQGANTGLVDAGVPDDTATMVVLSTDRLNPSIEIDPIGATASVGAGCRLSQLNEVAAEVGLRLPVDIAADPSIGGMTATNAAGSYVLRYGSMRNHVLGLDVCVADPTPRLVEGGGALRKDARGPVPWQEFIGAQGQLGVVTHVAVALTPLPSGRACAFVAFADFRQAIGALAVLRRALGAGLVAFELISDTALWITAEHAAGIRVPWAAADPERTGCTAMIEVETFGSAAAEPLLVDALATLHASGPAEPLDTAVVEPDAAWAVRHAISPALAAAGAVLGLDVAAPVDRLAELRGRIWNFVRTEVPDALLADFGHAGDGGLHTNLLFDAALGDRPGAHREAEIRLAISRLAVAVGGTYSAEHGIGPANAAAFTELATPDQRQAWRQAKARWDPTDLFGRPFQEAWSRRS